MKQSGTAPRRPPKIKTYITAVLVIGLFILSVQQTDATLSKLFQGAPQITNFLMEMFPPDWAFFGKILKPMRETLQMAIVGSTIGAMLAFPLSLMAAQNVVKNSYIRVPVRLVLNLARTIPDLLYAALFAVVVGFGPTAGTMALIFFTFGIISKLAYESVEAIDPGPLESMTAVGANKLKWIRYGVLPQVGPTFLAHFLYTFEVAIRASAILGLVGAGGIGLLLKNSLDLFRYDQACSIVLFTLVVVVVIDLVSTRVRRYLLTGSTKPVSPVRAKWNAIVIAIVAVGLFIWSVSGLQFTGLQPTTWIFTKNIIKGLFNPDWSYVYNPEGEDLIRNILLTLAISYLGTIVSALICIPFVFWAASNLSRSRAVSGSGKLFLSIVRTVPEVIMALIFIKAVGPNPFAGVLALGVHSVGMLGKLNAEAVENMDMGPTEAMTACGANRLKTLAFAVVPQVIPEFLSYILYRFEINLRSATLLGIIGAGGIGTPLIFAINARGWERVGIILIGIVITVSFIDAISAYLRKRII
jgi:phosphonate ABC transporter permease subunit PhnE